MDNLALMLTLGAKDAGMTKALADANKGLGGMGEVAGVAGKAMLAVGVAGAGAVAVGIGAAVKAAAGFEQQMSGVKAVSGATAEEMKSLSGLALQLGKDTSFSASEAAAGIEELVKGGLTIPDIMNGAAKATLNLAAAGGVSLPEAATIAANALAQFNLKGEDMAHVSDLIAGAANASALDVSDFSFSLKAAGAVAATVGFSFDDLAEGIAIMGKAGITGSDAGTSLKTMMLNLQPATKEQKKLFRELGIVTEDGANQFFDATGKVKGLSDVAQVLQTSLAGMTEQQRIAALEVMFGSDAIRAGAVLAKEGAAGFDAMAASMGKVSAESVGAEKLNNFNGSVQQLQGSLETAGIILGTAFLPALKGITDAATAGVNAAIPLIEVWGPRLVEGIGQTIVNIQVAAEKTMEFGNAINDNKLLMGAIVVVLTAAATAYGLMTAATIAHSVASTAAAAVTKTVTAAQWLLNAAMTANPIGLLVVAIAGLVAALVYAYHNSEDFRNAVDAAWAGVQAATAVAWVYIEPVLQALGALWASLSVSVPEAAGAISTQVSGIMTALSAVLGAIWEGIKNVIMLHVGVLIGLVTGDWTTASTAWQAIMTGLAEAMGTIWEGLKTATVATVEATATLVTDAFSALVTAGLALFQGGPGAFVPRLVAIFLSMNMQILDTLTGGAATSLKNMVGNGLRAVVDWGAQQLDQVYERLVGPFQGAWNKIKGLLDAIMSAYETAKRILSNFPGVPGGGGGGNTSPAPGGPGNTGPAPSSVGASSVGGSSVGGLTIVVNVAGSVVTEGQLIDAVHAGFLQKQRRNGSLGLIGGA